jgi:hypothetical protein
VTTNVVDSPVVNRPPVAVDDHTTIGEDTAAVNQCEGQRQLILTATHWAHRSILTTTVNGTIVTVASNGNVTHVPNPGLHSTNGQPVDSFKYQVCDTLSAHNPKPLCDTAEAYIYVTPRNLPPTADTIRYTTYDSVPHDVNVLLATSDPNGDPLTISIVSNPEPDGNGNTDRQRRIYHYRYYTGHLYHYLSGM